MGRTNQPADDGVTPSIPADRGRPGALELTSARLRLRTTTASDRAELVAIRSTPEVQARWRGDDLEAEFDELLDDDEIEPLTIEERDGAVVGFIQFVEADDPDYRHASIDLYIAPAHHRKGYATEAIATLVDHLLGPRGHHRLTIDPAADNEAAIACYRRVGFRPIGTLRRYERQADGSWADGLLMELLDTDPRLRPRSDGGLERWAPDPASRGPAGRE